MALRPEQPSSDRPASSDLHPAGYPERAGSAASSFQGEMERIRRLAHRRCVVCGAEAARDLRVEFEALPDGSVQGVLAGRPDLEGYPHTLHGGVIASLLDGAMTNCLFAHGVVAVTGKLTVRYRHPVSTDRPVRVRAWIEDASDDLFLMASELQQAERVAARGKAKFARRP